jgi:hypothetical protein
MLLAFAAAAVLAVAADLALERAGFTAAETGSAAGTVRLD